jgi:Ca2+-binding RTX toxin-like protein
MDINLEFDAAAMAAPASFRAGLQSAANILDATIYDNITVNIEIQYNENGISSGSAEAGPDNSVTESYSTLSADLVGNAAPGDTTFNFLPAGSSVQGQSQVVVWSAEAKALGLMSANGTGLDGTADFSADVPTASLVGVGLHELVHAMGRVEDAPTPDIMDLFRFTSPGTLLAFNNSIPAPSSYFSVNGGATDLAEFGISSDPADFLNPPNSNLTPEDAFNEFYDSGTNQSLSQVDLDMLDALGFSITPLGQLVATALSYGGFNSTTHGAIFTWVIEDLGGACNTTTAGFYYSTTSSSLGTLFSTSSIPSLGASSAIDENTSTAMPSGLFGTYYFTVVANYNDAVKESTFANDQSNSVPILVDSRTSGGIGALTGTSGVNVLIGLNSSGDIVTTGPSGDTMIGGASNDTFDISNHGSGTNNTNFINGGGGTNTLNYSGSSGAMIVNLATGMTSNYYGGTDYFSNIQNVVGSPWGDTYIGGTGGGYDLFGGAGNNTFDMSGGTSFISGGTGFNTLDYQFATGPVTVSMVTDTTSYYYGGTDHFNGIEQVVGSGFNDTLIGGSAGVEFSAGTGNNTMVGGTGNVTFDVWSHSSGTNFTDYITGGSGYNVLSYSGAPGPVNVNMATGTTLNYYGGTDHFSHIQDVVGSDYNDTLIGGSAAVTFQAGLGTDTMIGGSGNVTYDLWSHTSGSDHNDYITGGTGLNILNYSESPGPINVNLQTGTTSNYYGGTDYFSQIQEVVGNIYNDIFIGALTGGDTLIGGGGNNMFDMSGGTDYINGGSGFNTLDYAFAPGPVDVNMATETTSYYYGGDDHFSNIEQVIGSGYNDFLIGGSAGVEFNAGTGNDTMIGGTGNATFDVWSHGPGTNFTDYITGGSGYNVLNYSGAPGPVTVNMATGTTSNYYGGTDHFSHIQDVVGSAYNDTLIGGSTAVTFDAGSGADTMIGGSGNDTFELWSHDPGTNHNDYISGGSGTNTLDYSQSPGPVNVNMMTGTTSNYYGGTDFFSNIQHVVGSAFNDTLIANGANTVLTGGSGHDTFEFVEGHAGGATVTNFVSGTDQLEFNGFGTTGATFVKDTSTTWTVTSASGTDHEVITFSNAPTILASDYHFV